MDKGSAAGLLGLVVTVGVGLGSFIAGVGTGMSIRQNEAIEAGVARWTIDAKSGIRKFEWLTPDRKQR